MGQIFKKFFNTIITVGFIPVIFAVFAIFYFQSASKKNLINNWQKLCDSFAISSYQSIDNFAKRLDYLYYLREIYKNDGEFLKKISDKYEEVEFVSILNEKGLEKARYSDGGFSRLFKKLDLSSEEYFGRLKNKKEGVIGDFRIIGNVPLATIVYPLGKDFIYVAVNLKKFFSHIYTTRIGETGFVFFISENGVVLSDEIKRLGYREIEKIVKNSYGYSEMDINEKEYMAVFRKVGELDIYAVVAQERREFFRDVNLIFYSLLFLIFMVLTGSYFIALNASQKLAMPISSLVEASKNVANGVFDKQIEEKSDFTELNELISVFNKMSSKLDEYSKIQIEKIMDEREKLNIITQNLNIVIALSNISGYPVYLNPKAKEVLGENQDEIREFIHEKIYEISKNKSKIVKIKNKYFDINIDIIKFQREKPLILFVAEDVTLTVNMQKMKEEVFRSIAHDIRSPLLNMQGYIKLLSYTEDEKIRRYSKGLKEESDIVFKMIENILDISRIENKNLELDLKQTDLSSLLKKLSERFEVRAEVKNIRFEKNIPDFEVYALIDPELFQRAVENILTNAFKYTDNGGRVRLELKKEEKIKIIVSDTGKGIEKQRLGEIFERFKSYSKDGFGLGLNIAKTIIELHKGKIEVFSEPGKGTTFILSI
ncbi:MAG: ATP-binding protein [Elusimicrobiota bacterium]